MVSSRIGVGRLLALVVLLVCWSAVIRADLASDPADPPQWTMSPITLSRAKEGALYTQNIAQYATDDEGDAILTFSKVSGPAWAGVTPAGALTGSPARADLGSNRFVVRVSDQYGQSADATINLEVEKTLRPPYWKQDPLPLANGLEGAPYVFDVSAFAATDEGLVLTFSKVSGPGWLNVGTDGKLSGVPQRDDLGTFTASLEVSDGFQTARVTGSATVVHKAHPPVIDQAGLSFLVRERQTFHQDLKAFVSSPDGQPLTFRLLAPAAWIRLAATGEFTAMPAHEQLGEHDLPFSVAAGRLSATGSIHVSVQRDARPPIWARNPIRLEAKAGKHFSGTIAAEAKDLDGVPLKFSKTAGPAWLGVNSDGTFEGVPQTADLGQKSFTLSVSNDAEHAETQLLVSVVDPFPAPIWIQDPVDLATATEKAAYSQSLLPYVRASGVGDALTFNKLGGPEWAVVTASGVVVGTPQNSDAGVNVLSVRATNIAGKTTDVTLRIFVARQKTPPRWKTNPLVFGELIEDSVFHFVLSAYAVDDHGYPLTFWMTSGPKWLITASDGSVSGVPSLANEGDFTAHFVVSNGNETAEVDAKGKVMHRNHPPVLHPGVIPYSLKEHERKTADLKPYASDPDGDKLTFSLPGAPTWASVTSDGQLTLSPLHPQLGEQSLVLSVSDGKESVSGTLLVSVARDARPPIWQQSAGPLQASLGHPFYESIAGQATDPDGVPVIFSKKSGPAWVAVGEDGTVSGTPPAGSLGENIVVVSVRNDLLFTDATVQIEVSDPHQGPAWARNPLPLPDGQAARAYAQSLVGLARAYDGDALTFSKLAGPDWVFVGAGGSVMGIPTKKDVGLNSIQARVTDAHGKTSDTVLQVSVEAAPYHPPRWAKTPLDLGISALGKAFQFDLTKFEVDDGGDPVRFKMLKGPAWLVTSTAGKLSGTPGKTDAGEYVAQFELSDGTTSVPVDAFGKVVPPGGHAPVAVPGALSFVVKAGGSASYDLGDPSYVSNPDGNRLGFALDSTDAWVALASTGKLSLAPGTAEVGDHLYTVRITDEVQGLTSSGCLFVRVLADPDAPVWVEHPVRFEAFAGKPFQASLAGKATSKSHALLTFRKTAGADWLSIGANGTLAGTPPADILGDARFTVMAASGSSQAEGLLIITVRKQTTMQVQTVAVDAKVSGAPVEALWVVDNAPGSGELVAAFEQNLPAYFSDLQNAQVSSGMLYLSSAADSYDGAPIAAADGGFLFSAGDTDPGDAIKQRADASYVEDSYNSPLWSLQRFYDQLKGLAGIYHQGYFEAQVPMEVLIVSAQRDRYAHYASGTSHEGETEEAFAQRFAGLHGREEKSFRVSALGIDSSRAQAGTYQSLTEATGGTFYPWSSDLDVAQTMHEYARSVIFRAYAQAKRRIKLDQRPDPASPIEVRIGGKMISGDSGKTDDPWYYDVRTNEIVLRWYRIDEASLQAGDVIEIRYQG